MNDGIVIGRIVNGVAISDGGALSPVPLSPAVSSPPPTAAAPLSAAAIAARIATCQACDHYRADSDRCALCGCGDTTARRARSPWQRCPAGRWPT